jgi:hypothetical protein
VKTHNRKALKGRRKPRRMTPMTTPTFAGKHKMNLANQAGPQSLRDEHWG